jgi:thioredoxin 1
MNKLGKILTVAFLIVAVIVIFAVRQVNSSSVDIETLKPEQLLGKGLPAMIDFGAGKCIKCKMMTPVLKELKKEMAGQLQVNYIDVGKYSDLADVYKIELIPTQIFFDASGKELFRHEGFISKEDILSKWAELGVEFIKSK